jgi:hypothetical protein
MHYILNGREIVPADLMTWAAFFEDFGKRVVAKTKVGDAEVSTVFLGTDHRFRADGPPVLFETMVFDGPLDGEQERYCTYDEAEAGHRQMIERCRAALAAAVHKAD